MDVSPNELRKQTVQTLRQINIQIQEVQVTAAGRGVTAEKLHDHHGGYTLAPLLLAKAQCLNTLALLNERR